MNILILGSGGREHALAWKIAQSPLTGKLYVAPGNAGTREVATNLNLSPTDFDSVQKAIKDYQIDMLVVGPEQPLVEGIRDALEQNPAFADLLIIGPGKQGAQLEGSKAFAKEFMLRHGIPTAQYRSFTAGDYEDARKYIQSLQPPYVLKADGLAAGKGVIITSDTGEAVRTAEDILLHQKFGKAGDTLLVEQFLEGIEMSVFVLTDGEDYILLPEAKDYKRIGEGDTGANTGGMGAVSPVPFASQELMQKIESRIIRRSIDGLKKDGIPYSGFIFFGLMIANGEPYVIEYNVRMGDPETEVVLPRIDSDLVELLRNTATGNIPAQDIKIKPETAVTVMAVSGGYPGTYEKGKTIHLPENPGLVFHAGTRFEGDKLLTNGGRVFCVTSFGESIRDAADKSYSVLEKARFEGMYYRRDIGKDLLDRS